MVVDFDRFKMGYGILWKNKDNIVGKIIEQRQLKCGIPKEDACYTHIDISGSGPNAVFVGLPFSRVVDIRTFHKGYQFKVVKFRHPTFTIKRYKVAFWAASKCNLLYDMRGVVHFVLPFIPHNKYLPFCSENYLESLQKEYPGACGMKPQDFMPAHALNKDFHDVVYEGCIE